MQTLNNEETVLVSGGSAASASISYLMQDSNAIQYEIDYGQIDLWGFADPGPFDSGDMFMRI